MGIDRGHMLAVIIVCICEMDLKWDVPHTPLQDSTFALGYGHLGSAKSVCRLD